ncbi:MAG: FMN-binding protein [Spirochaetales bacterium]|nr:FMN-binding protein [Spirochaetales bacterium]
MNKQSLVYTVIFTFVVSFIFVAVLAVANEGTRAQVDLNQQLSRQQAILNAIGIPYSGPSEVQQRFAAVQEIDRDGTTLYRTEIDGEVVFAKEFSGSGLWGMITGVLAVTEDLDRTVGMEIITHNETPGLGGRIDEDWFKEQLRDERIVDGAITVARAGDGDTDMENGAIDAVTGASRTSDSMQVIFDTELMAFASLLGGTE